MVVAAVTSISSSSPMSTSPCVSFIEEYLLLPTRNAGLFAPAFLLISAHTSVFLAVAVLRVHPLATADARLISSTDPASHDHAVAAGRIREHANELVFLYLAYLASRLTAQVATVLSASATCSGERPSFAQLVRYCKVAKEKVRGPFVTAAFAAVLELASTALLVAVTSLASRRMYAAGPGAEMLGCVLWLLLALLLHLCVGAVVPVSIAVSAGDEGCCYGTRALWRAWRMMGARARRKEAAVQVVAAGLFPVATYPVYALAVEFTQGDTAYALYDQDRQMWVLGVLYAYVLPSAAAQLYSTVAATVFHHRCTHGIYTRRSL